MASTAPATIRVIDHEALGTVESLVADGKGSTTFYRIDDLYLAASEEPKAKILTNFKSAPFVDDATGLAFFRARWYGPGTGQVGDGRPHGVR